MGTIQNQKECTTLNQLKTFLGTHANLLETIDQNEAEKFRTNFHNPVRKENKTFITSTESSCPVCNEHHAIYSCTTFLNLDINNRIKKIKELKLCLNCLKGGHYTATCKSGYCKQCKGKHNSLLHLQKKEVGTTVDNSASTNSTTFASYSEHNSYVLLPTAVVNIKDNEGNYKEAIALLDTASQSSYISEELHKK
jgi:hypothetical protein